jgi:pSer/pThr/pTyr-binding forkhead associated (FHA) protein
VEKVGKHFTVQDLDSSNGTFVNGKRIPPRTPVKVTAGDKITLGGSLPLDLGTINWNQDDLDATRILVQNKDQNPNPAKKSPAGAKPSQSQTVLVDADRTGIGEILSLSSDGFQTVGRTAGNTIVLDNPRISRNHCKLRLISPELFEIVDLASTNGTYVDNQKLTPNKSYFFSSRAEVKLGNSLVLPLKKVLPGIHIPKENIQQPSPPSEKRPGSDLMPTPAEAKQFIELESVWKEYAERQQKANTSQNSFAIGGMLAGSIAGLAFGPVGALLGIGGQILGRYIGQQKSNEIRYDLTYEDAFLQIYACPRCMESFQKKPWITIRECFKCKTKFR